MRSLAVQMFFPLSWTAFLVASNVGMCSDPILVELEEKPHKGRVQLVGELKLGRLTAGDKVEQTFVLKNSSTSEFSPGRIKTSCSCADIKISKATIPSNGLSRECKISATTPQAMGKDFQIAEFWIFDGFESELPKAVVLVSGDVFRPYAIRDRRNVFPVSKATLQKVRFPLDVLPETDVTQIQVKVIGIENVEVGVVRKSESNAEVMLTLSREQALANPSLVAELSFIAKGMQFSDSVIFDFLDSAKIRVTPSSLVFTEGVARFIVFRREGLKSENILVEWPSKDKTDEISIELLSPTTASVTVSSSKDIEYLMLSFKDSGVSDSLRLPVLQKY